MLSTMMGPTKLLFPGFDDLDSITDVKPVKESLTSPSVENDTPSHRASLDWPLDSSSDPSFKPNADTPGHPDAVRGDSLSFTWDPMESLDSSWPMSSAFAVDTDVKTGVRTGNGVAPPESLSLIAPPHPHYSLECCDYYDLPNGNAYAGWGQLTSPHPAIAHRPFDYTTIPTHDYPECLGGGSHYSDDYTSARAHPPARSSPEDPTFHNAIHPKPFWIPSDPRSAYRQHSQLDADLNPTLLRRASYTTLVAARHPPQPSRPLYWECQWRAANGGPCHVPLDDTSAAGIARHLREHHFPNGTWEKTSRGHCRWGHCDRPLMDYASFGKHIASVHLRDVNAWACSFCQREFGRRDAMRRHMKTCPKAPEDKKPQNKALARVGPYPMPHSDGTQ